MWEDSTTKEKEERQRMMENLKPCPFCGEQPVLQKVPIRGYSGCFHYIVECENPECRCNIKLSKNDTIYNSDKDARQNAINAWNRRVDKSNLVSRQAVKEWLKRWRGYLDDDMITRMQIRTIDIPTEELIKHGHWIDTGSGEECSICREIQYGYDSFRNYCANCGAKMDEVSK